MDSAVLDSEIRQFLSQPPDDAVGTLPAVFQGTAGPSDTPTVSLKQDPGTRVIYDLNTGEPYRASVVMAPAHLQKVDADGKRMFGTRPPADVTPTKGTYKCLLHADHEMRQQLKAWGFGTCPKASLPSEYMVDEHVRHSHKVAWATIQRHRAEMEKRAETERREAHEKALVAALAGRVDNESRGRKASA